MSIAQTPGDGGSDPEYTGPDRYIKFARHFFGIEPTAIQRELMRAVAEHKRVIAVGANGPGKSYIAAALNGAFLYLNRDSICMPTSGTYSVLDDTLWKPLKTMVGRAQERAEERSLHFPGRRLENPPRIQIDDEWYFKAASPTHPDNLEGRHAGTMLITIEEADKPDISREHLDSAESMITDDNDRMLVIANPPVDESNLVYELMEDENWHTIQFSSFESRNVRIDMGEETGEKVPGLVDLETVKYDWERWNNEPWPGAEQARQAHLERTDLDSRWYRRRAGVMPPDGAESPRPFYAADIREALENPLQTGTGSVVGIGYDVARMGGDSNVIATLYENTATIKEWTGTDHTENESTVRGYLNAQRANPPLAIDAVGEGSGIADRIDTVYGRTKRFKNGQKAVDEQNYYDRWTEGLVALGKRLSGLRIDADSHLREELFTAARVIELEDKRRRSGDVVKATPKSEIKERLGRSPDRLDALVMAAWAADATGGKQTRVFPNLGF